MMLTEKKKREDRTGVFGSFTSEDIDTLTVRGNPEG
jgi:hypothetical protein